MKFKFAIILAALLPFVSVGISQTPVNPVPDVTPVSPVSAPDIPFTEAEAMQYNLARVDSVVRDVRTTPWSVVNVIRPDGLSASAWQRIQIPEQSMRSVLDTIRADKFAVSLSTPRHSLQISYEVANAQDKVLFRSLSSGMLIQNNDPVAGIRYTLPDHMHQVSLFMAAVYADIGGYNSAHFVSLEKDPNPFNGLNLQVHSFGGKNFLEIPAELYLGERFRNGALTLYGPNGMIQYDNRIGKVQGTYPASFQPMPEIPGIAALPNTVGFLLDGVLNFTVFESSYFNQYDGFYWVQSRLLELSPPPAGTTARKLKIRTTHGHAALGVYSTAVGSTYRAWIAADANGNVVLDNKAQSIAIKWPDEVATWGGYGRG